MMSTRTGHVPRETFKQEPLGPRKGTGECEEACELELGSSRAGIVSLALLTEIVVLCLRQMMCVWIVVTF